MANEAADKRLLLRAIRRSGDESSPDSLLLLWFLRNVMVVDEFDAYEFVAQDSPGLIDGLYLEQSFDPEVTPTLFVFEAKVPSGNQRIARDAVERFAAGVDGLRARGLESIGSLELR